MENILIEMALTSALENYNPIWPDLFELEKKSLTPLFKGELVEIHHVGSTAVPGMTAKPEIVILIILRSSTNFKLYFPAIESVGYRFRGEMPGAPGHWYFSKDQQGKRTHKLHLCGPDHSSVTEKIVFRDYLISNPDRAKAYAILKADLEKNNKSGMLEYLEKKTPFILETLRLAKGIQK
jgi:GrpB-like predicted nucleotidyltransferase (UPF0157 family)